MKNIYSFVVISGSMLISGLAWAQCDSSLEQKELMDCIVVEGSGENYTEWKDRFETEYRESQAALRQAESQQTDGQEGTRVVESD